MSYPHPPSRSRPLERILKNRLNAGPPSAINLCTGRADPPAGRGTGQPVENPAEMQPSKAHRTPDGEADDKDQGQRQRTPEAPIRKPDKRSPIRVETKSDTHP